MKRARRHLAAALLATPLLLATTRESHAQADWPRAKPVTFLVGFAPGSSTDIVTRIVAQKLGELSGGTFAVENKPGAGGNIATTQVKRAAPDGYTLLAHSVAFAVNPSLFAQAGYDAVKDFTPLILGPRTPNLIAVSPATPVRDLPELIALAKKQPLAYASSGIGTTTHLSIERLKTAAGIDIVHVPYQPAQAIAAVIGGQTPMSSTSMPPAVPQVKAGKLRAIAVTSAQRSSLMPDVPSVTEYGFKDFDDYTWFGFMAPLGTPTALVERINADINRIFEMPDVREKLAQLGMETTRNTPEQFGAFLRSEVPKWAEVVRTSGAKAE
jgi:tripartite-type tricarboxylate transporter receptor subunit TctC